MPLGPDPERARVAARRLTELRDTVAAGEEDVLASLVVTGEPRAQRVLDDWLDQVADTLRAIGETADEVRSALPVPASDAEVSPERTAGLREVDR